MKNIATALVNAQRKFSPALKCSTNPHFRSKYADLAACLEAVQDPLNDNGIALLQVTHDDPTGVTVETVFIHESGERISGGRLHVPASKQDAQGYGSALTYARRYSILAACGIAPEDDDGNAATSSYKDKALIIPASPRLILWVSAPSAWLSSSCAPTTSKSTSPRATLSTRMAKRWVSLTAMRRLP